MAELQQFFEMFDTYGKVVDFAMVYIEEAHPNGGWMLKVSKI